MGIEFSQLRFFGIDDAAEVGGLSKGGAFVLVGEERAQMCTQRRQALANPWRVAGGVLALLLLVSVVLVGRPPAAAGRT